MKTKMSFCWPTNSEKAIKQPCVIPFNKQRVKIYAWNILSLLQLICTLAVNYYAHFVFNEYSGITRICFYTKALSVYCMSRYVMMDIIYRYYIRHYISTLYIDIIYRHYISIFFIGLIDRGWTKAHWVKLIFN